MRRCAACSLPLYQHALRCPRCGQVVPQPDGQADVDALDLEQHAGTARQDSSTSAASGAPIAQHHAPDFAAPAQPVAASPEREGDADWDPEQTTRFRTVPSADRTRRNVAALVSIGVALVAAVVSLAWLIAQVVMPSGRTAPTAPTSGSATPFAPSTTVPRNATICTPEVARSTNTTCAVATRVLTAVRVLGTDLPESFRVTIVDPATKKNATYVCTVRSWIECVGSSDMTVYVKRVA